MTDADADHHPLAGVRRFVAEVWGDDFPLYLPSLVAIGFGLMLMLPADTFESGKSFATMARVADLLHVTAWREVFWGSIYIAVGAAHAAALYGRSATCKRARELVVATWVTTMLMFAIAFFANTGLVAYGGYALLGHWGRHRVRPRQ